MAKIRITTLTDKMKDDEILSKLKGIGVKIKDKEKEKEDQAQSLIKETATASGETIIEKRVASTVIRRRVQAPPPVTETKTAPVEIRHTVEETGAEKEEPPKRADEPVVELVRTEKERRVEERILHAEKASAQERLGSAEAEAAGIVDQAGPAEGVLAETVEEAAKSDADTIGEDKKQEITRALEEVYKQDLNKEFVLVADEETEEERKKKKAERLLKKIEEEEIEEAKTKGKGVSKRKVVRKEKCFPSERTEGIEGKKDPRTTKRQRQNRQRRR